MKLSAVKEQEAIRLLKKNRLSVTAGRKKILLLFLGRNDALTHGDIEKGAGEKFDRVTIYRTLQAFVESGIIHTIPTTDNSIRYALCKDACGNGQHQDQHIHFICTLCQSIICLDEVVTPAIQLPEGFAPQSIKVVAEGICKNCR